MNSTKHFLYVSSFRIQIWCFWGWVKWIEWLNRFGLKMRDEQERVPCSRVLAFSPIHSYFFLQIKDGVKFTVDSKNVIKCELGALFCTQINKELVKMGQNWLLSTIRGPYCLIFVFLLTLIDSYRLKHIRTHFSLSYFDEVCPQNCILTSFSSRF